jgi:hypothetical protein
VRGKGDGWQVFPSVLGLRYQLGNFIPHAGTKAAMQWSVFIGVVTSEELAGLDEELGDNVLEGEEKGTEGTEAVSPASMET